MDGTPRNQLLWERFVSSKEVDTHRYSRDCTVTPGQDHSLLDGWMDVLAEFCWQMGFYYSHDVTDTFA